MQFTTKVLNSEQSIVYGLLNLLLKDINLKMQKIARSLESDIKNLVKNAISNSPEYQSLISGKLKYNFGLPDSASRLSEILSVWERITVDYTKPSIQGSQISSNIKIYMIKADYSDVLNLSASYFTTEKGSELKWLEWLLLAGDKTIIRDYEIIYNSSPNSRTGGAVMKKVVSGKWNVPPEFAGVYGNNWITRVLDSIENDIDNTIQKAIKL